MPDMLGNFKPVSLLIAAGWVRSGSYVGPRCSTRATVQPGNNYEFARPVVIPAATTLVEIGAEVTTGGEAGSTIRLGIRADSGAGYPASSAPLADSGAIASTSTGYKSAVISVTVMPGLYWFTIAVQSAPSSPPVIRADVGECVPVLPASGSSATSGAFNGYRQVVSTGALPSTWSSTVDAQGSCPRVVAKYS